MNQLKTLRKARHISQADIADELGIKPAAISKYETGRVPLSEDAIGKLCMILHVSADELLGLSSERPAPSNSAPSVASKILGQIYPASTTMEDYLTALLNTVAAQKKQMDQTIRNLHSCGIPTATIARVTSINEDKILELLGRKETTGSSLGTSNGS